MIAAEGRSSKASGTTAFHRRFRQHQLKRVIHQRELVRHSEKRTHGERRGFALTADSRLVFARTPNRVRESKELGRVEAAIQKRNKAELQWQRNIAAGGAGRM